MALPSASEVPTTSPSHGSTSGGHVKSYGAYAIPRFRYVHARPPVCRLNASAGRFYYRGRCDGMQVSMRMTT